MDENTRCDGRGDSDGGKGAYDGTDERWRGRAKANVTESCNQREKNKRKHTVGMSEHEVGRGCLTSTRTEKGRTGHGCLVSTRPDAGRFIAGAIHTKQVLQGTTGELKGAKKIRTGREGGNVLYTA